MNSHNRHSKLKADVDLEETVDQWVIVDADGTEAVCAVEQSTALEDVRFSMTERVLEYAPDYFIKLMNGRMFRVFAAAKLEEINQQQFDARGDDIDDDE